MSYRVWPAGLFTTAALAAACVVVGGHVADAGDGCLGSKSFIATPASWPADPSGVVRPTGKSLSYKASNGWPAIGDRVGQTNDVPPSRDLHITGCIDVDRIEIPVTDGRA